MKKPLPRIPLKTLGHIRSEMARVYRDIKCGNIDPQTGTRLCYVLTCIGRIIEGSDFEQRIALLEQGHETTTETT